MEGVGDAPGRVVEIEAAEDLEQHERNGGRPRDAQAGDVDEQGEQAAGPRSVEAEGDAERLIPHPRRVPVGADE